ncbi:hypothetical protein [Marinobacter sp. SS5-14b]|jgi:hypothetical protein|uniref:hypothetical protein n=1 Tax=Marinobacter sp. SS5-14b TaxID=3050456 RepID=UPI000C68FB15|nr:hypothetical protein [Marinobacter sp. SS5-14b]MBQ91878.1 hypothetical protein [Marinobacter sp.]|tara:strand:+ start:992 stop:1396 length:405 start_codon:yes stop_codon:yes gene_type:complete
MTYLLMIFAGGVTGLYLAGPVGAFLGVLAGVGGGAWLEQTEPTIDDAIDADYSLPLRDSDAVSYGSYDDDAMFYEDRYQSTVFDINPATGLPMVNDSIGGIDVGGNPYGYDLSSHDDIFSSSSVDSMFDDFNHD